jgi:hypothetical protein
VCASINDGIDRISLLIHPLVVLFASGFFQVLSRDIRSVHHRLRSKKQQVTGYASGSESLLHGSSEQWAGEATAAPGQVGFYHVVLAGVDCHYDIDSAAMVLVRGAAIARKPT